MLRWLLLLGLSLRVASASSLRWCTGELDAEEPFAMPETISEEDRQIAELEIKKAEREALEEAKRLGRGKKVTELLVKNAMIKARDAAHDRFHTRELEKQIAPPEELEEVVPVMAQVPARVLDAMLKEAEKNK